MKYVGVFLPKSVPRVIFEGDGYFATEYLGEEFANWKQLMLDGRYEPDYAALAGNTLGVVHQTSLGDEAARECFDSTGNFHQLRSEPYLVTTGSRHSDLTASMTRPSVRLNLPR